jgi:hypothetical protein
MKTQRVVLCVVILLGLFIGYQISGGISKANAETCLYGERSCNTWTCNGSNKCVAA